MKRNNDIQVHYVMSQSDAEHILEERNVWWIQRYRHDIMDHRPYKERISHGIHIHYMISDNEEIAYYTPGMFTLTIFEKTRHWDNEFIETARVV